MNIYTFRILFEGENEIFRDVQIKETQNFEELHDIIVAAFGFDNAQMASFYCSDEQWNKGQEITLFDMNMEGEDHVETPLVMEEVQLKTKVKGIGEHFLYSYDFLNMKNFFIELIEVDVEDAEAFYPKVIYSQGELPTTESTEMDDVTAEKKDLTDEELADQLLREAGFEDEANDDFNDFMDIDNLDNY